MINEQEIKSNSVYAICGLKDVPSQRARGFHLMVVGDDGHHTPWSILVVRWGKRVFGYTNKCPHNNVNLDWEPNHFLDPNGTRLMCGKHGSRFELGTGRCVEGPCKGSALTPIALMVLDGDICVTGVRLLEDERNPSSKS